jgi:5'(3')-deoxyribonucleotidase
MRKENKKILYVDMDGVLANFDKKVLEINPSIITLSSHAPNYEERFKMVEKVMMDNPRMFLDLEPIEGSIEAVKRLWEHYDILFLSTPCWLVPESYMDKRHWIQKYFGDVAKDRLILSQRKELNMGDFLVDDRLSNGAEYFWGKHLHFGHGEYPTWVEVEKFLMKKQQRQTFFSNSLQI